MSASQILPDVNATWTGEGPRILGNIDIATTVTTNGDLVAPVIRNAASLGLREISLATGVSQSRNVDLCLLRAILLLCVFTVLVVILLTLSGVE